MAAEDAPAAELPSPRPARVLKRADHARWTINTVECHSHPRDSTIPIRSNQSQTGEVGYSKRHVHADSLSKETSNVLARVSSITVLYCHGRRASPFRRRVFVCEEELFVGTDRPPRAPDERLRPRRFGRVEQTHEKVGRVRVLEPVPLWRRGRVGPRRVVEDERRAGHEDCRVVREAGISVVVPPDHPFHARRLLHPRHHHPCRNVARGEQASSCSRDRRSTHFGEGLVDGFGREMQSRCPPPKQRLGKTESYRIRTPDAEAAPMTRPHPPLP